MTKPTIKTISAGDIYFKVQADFKEASKGYVPIEQVLELLDWVNSLAKERNIRDGITTND